MPNTYTLIASNTLSSSAASVTFSSIPGTYTDLVLRWSARVNSAVTYTNFNITINNNTGSIYSRTWVRGDGSAAASGRASSATILTHNMGVDGTSATSNTFSSGELYIPSYTAAQNKPMGAFWAQENNTTEAYILAQANLFSSTAAIDTIKCESLADFLSGSSFFLYGIKNS